MEKVKVSVVSYLNSKPFIHGLEHSNVLNDINLSLDIPSDCAAKLLQGIVDVGLVPVAIIPELKEHYIISDYCIGADGPVNSVMLYSEVPLNEIETIVLDYQSRTSVQLVKVLAKKHWKISPSFVDGKDDFVKSIEGKAAGLVIGDRTFKLNGSFSHEFDLADEWKKFSGLPFVFACWVANKKLTQAFLENFNGALAEGIDQKEQVIKALQEQENSQFNIKQYLSEQIHYELDSSKRKGLELFLSYLSKGQI